MGQKRRRVQQRISVVRNLQTIALEAVANAVVITDRAGLIQWVNPAFTQLTGYAAREAIGQTPRLLNSGVHSDSFFKYLWATVLKGDVWRGETYNKRKDGSVYVEEQTITPVKSPSGSVTYLIAIKQDVTERRRQEEQIRHLASHDALTNLPNRRVLEEGLQRVVEAARAGQAGALLLLDLDNFKMVNDSLGHFAGDQLLIALANHLAHTVGQPHLLVRLGGDEFAVLLEHASIHEAALMAERIRQAVNECHFYIIGHPFDTSVSIGVAPLDGRLHAHKAMALADSALYAAKGQGRNRVVVYQSELDQVDNMAEVNHVVVQIKTALREGRFFFQFQPIVNLNSGEVAYYEALIRMQTGSDQVVGPDAFIPVAERFGLISQIDRWVAETALRCLQQHRKERIFINLSGASLGDEALLDLLATWFRDHPQSARRLVVEITETAAVTDLQQTQRWMTKLQKLGCRFALDDFGQGFSSFSYLSNIPADYVKIAGTFVCHLDTDPASRAIVQALNTVAHALGKQVIAEWVETGSIAAALQQLGVEFGQGYHWGLPAAVPPRPG